jgi:hypothetical protein
MRTGRLSSEAIPIDWHEDPLPIMGESFQQTAWEALKASLEKRTANALWERAVVLQVSHPRIQALVAELAPIVAEDIGPTDVPRRKRDGEVNKKRWELVGLLCKTDEIARRIIANFRAEFLRIAILR